MSTHLHPDLEASSQPGDANGGRRWPAWAQTQILCYCWVFYLSYFLCSNTKTHGCHQAVWENIEENIFRVKEIKAEMHHLMFWSNRSFNVKNHKTSSRPCRGGASAPCDPRLHHSVNINNQMHQMTACRGESGSMLPRQRKMSLKIKGHEDDNRKEKSDQDSESLTDSDRWPSNRTS